MVNDKHVFSGGVNADGDKRFLGVDESLNIENFRIGVYGEGQNFNLENVPSSLLKYYYLPTGDNLCIGRIVDYARLRIVWFNYNSNGDHGIYAYDVQLDTTYIVLLDSQTEEGLNFSRSFRIDRNARVIGNLLIWTDNNNEPQCINIERGIKLNQPSYTTDVVAYDTPVPFTTSALIKRPPIYPMDIEKTTDGGFANNYIVNNAYQFCYRYQYKDFQYSALSSFSDLAPYNSSGDTFNCIQISVPFSEFIDEYVQQVDFCVRYGNTGQTFIIQSFNKDFYYDRLAIESHNSDSVQLSFTFFDSVAGIALDEITANTSFHNVALRAKTVELARNRCFLGNVLKGYDTPTETSLAFTAVPATAGEDLIGRWGIMQITYTFRDSDDITEQYYYLLVQPHSPSIYYYPAIQPPDVPPDPIDLTTAAYSTSSYHALATYIAVNRGFDYDRFQFEAGEDITPYTSAISGGGTALDDGDRAFKSNNTYRVAVVFFDRFRRKCGLVIPRTPDITMTQRTYEQTVWNAGIQWTVSNINALTEIPDWAYYYQIYITKSQTTRFFEQARATDITYVIKEDDGTYTYDHDDWSLLNPRYAVAVNTSTLTSFGYGYTFTEGDYVMLYFEGGTNYNLRVIGQDGNWVWISPTDLGTLNESSNVLFELYTPYRASTTEPYYEVGDIYTISNPGTVNRRYSVLSDIINGDIYIIQRAESDIVFYFVEAMSPNDLRWEFWQTNGGWTGFIDTIGQQLKETNIDWSDTYINGTKTNGLNNFQPLNTKDIGSTSGQIQKLQLTNKMEEAGDVMLVVAEEQVLSAYLQEVQLYKAAQSEGLISTDQVIGTINPLKFTCGTMNPESIVEWNGMVLGVDVVRGIVWSYDTNGITPVAYYKTRRFWDKYGKRYIEQGTAAIEALCGFSYIDSAIDPSTGEVLFALPQVEADDYAGNLPSYDDITPSYASSIQNRFDIYDGQPKIMIYKYEQNKWFGAYQWLPDAQENVGNKLYAWKDGDLYLMNENTASFNNIFGTQYPQRICFTANAQNPTVIKDTADIAVEGQEIPNYSVCYTDYQNEQITDLTEDDYKDQEGVQNATWFRDRLSPQITGNAETKMYKGDLIKSAAPQIMCEFQIYNRKFITNFIDIGFNISSGHNQLIQKPNQQPQP